MLNTNNQDFDDLIKETLGSDNSKKSLIKLRKNISSKKFKEALGSDQFIESLIRVRENISGKRFREFAALTWVVKHYNFRDFEIKYEQEDELKKTPDFQLIFNNVGRVVIECTTAPRYTRSQMFDTFLEAFKKRPPVTNETVINKILNGLSLFWNTSTQIGQIDKTDNKNIKKYHSNIFFTKLHKLKNSGQITQIEFDDALDKLNKVSKNVKLEEVEINDAHEVYDDNDEKEQVQQLQSILNKKFADYNIAKNAASNEGIKRLLVIDLSGFCFSFLRLDNIEKLEHLSSIQRYLKGKTNLYFNKVLIIEGDKNRYAEFIKNGNKFYLESFKSS